MWINIETKRASFGKNVKSLTGYKVKYREQYSVKICLSIICMYINLLCVHIDWLLYFTRSQKWESAVTKFLWVSVCTIFLLFTLCFIVCTICFVLFFFLLYKTINQFLRLWWEVLEFRLYFNSFVFFLFLPFMNFSDSYRKCRTIKMGYAS